jgi:uncharacterized membrane protein
MNTTATAAGATPAPKNLPARFIGIIVSPKDTFASLVPAPKWFGMMALTAVIVAFFTALPLMSDGGRQAALDQQVQQMQSLGFNVSDQMYDAMEKGKARMPYTAGIGVLVMTPIMAVVIAGILFAIFNAAMGGEASFKQVLSILTHAGAISSLSSVLSGTVNYLRGSAMTSVANLGALLPMLPEKSFIANLLGAVDVFLIWYILVLAIGLAVLYKRRTQPIAISLLSVYAVIALGIALFKSRAGGA